jgi:septal ring factor EnvC (AmiA/AmiB activator)
MTRGFRSFVKVLFSLVLAASFLLAGCTRYANEEQLTAMDETESSAVAAENEVAEKEKEKAELQAKLAEKQDELRKVQEEKEKVRSKL